MTEYQEHGLNITTSQLKKILTAGQKKTTVTIRISKKNLHGDHKLLLTKSQINKINKATSGLDLKLSITQIKKIHKRFVDLQKENNTKTGGFLPLLALLPLIFGGLGAAGGIAGGISSAVSSANSAKAQNLTQVENAKAQNLAQVETERHNRVLEKQNAAALKTGEGMLSDLAGKIPVFGPVIQLGLKKLGLGIDDRNRIKRGECICLGKGLYLGPVGSGLFLGPKSGHGLFLGPPPG
jgi:hypothetical protein